jgi:hypothetical protein
VNLVWELAASAGINPRNVHAKGIPAERADRMLVVALSGATRDRIVEAGGSERIQDGFTMRPIVESDADDFRRFVDQARRELLHRERLAREAQAAVDRLRAALVPERAA